MVISMSFDMFFKLLILVAIWRSENASFWAVLLAAMLASGVKVH